VNLHDRDAEPDQRCLARYAAKLRLAGAKQRYAQLIFIAPPRPLEILESELGRPYLRRLECVDPHDRVVEGPLDPRAHRSGRCG
jgi:hypothetical protein